MDILISRNRILYFDCLRVLACFSVVFLHTASQQFSFVTYGDSGWLTLIIVDAITRFSVPVFVMVSGVLFLDPNRPISLRSLHKKNLLRIITAFLFWSTIYASVDYLRGERLRTVVTNFASGNIHLWFLYMIAGLYLIVPFLRKITESKKLTEYFLIIWLVIGIGLTSMKLLFVYFGKHYSQMVETVMSEIGANYIIGFPGYYVLGYYLHTKEIPKTIRGILYTAGILSTTALVTAVVVYSGKIGYPFYAMFDSFTLFVVLQAVAVFVFFKYHSPKFKNPLSKRTLLVISKCSFGIYLMHVLFIDIGYQNLYIQNILPHPILSVPVLAVSVILLTLLISYILNKIPFINRYIV